MAKKRVLEKMSSNKTLLKKRDVALIKLPQALGRATGRIIDSLAVPS